MAKENKKIVLSEQEIKTKKIQLEQLELQRLTLELQIEHLERSIERDIPMKIAKSNLRDLENQKELTQRNIKIIEEQLS